MQAVLDRPPPSDTEEHGGYGDGWVRVFRAAGDIEAHLLCGRLETAGIETVVMKDRSGNVWMHGGSDPHAPVDILVRRLQLEDARIVLAEIAFEQPFPSASEPAWSWRTVVLWWGAAVALGLAFTGISLARTSDEINKQCAVRCADGRDRR